MQITSKFSSPNFDERERKIRYIVLHYTEMPFDEALAKLCDPDSGVSCHYLIHENGDVYNLVADEKRAWHAGESYWRGEKGINHSSIGIELDNLGTDYFTSKQMNSLITLCHELMEKYDIPSQNVIGHSDVAPARKLDPGIFFDWQYLSDHGIGLWPSRGLNDLDETIDSNEQIDIKQAQERLHKIGYAVKPTGIHDAQTNHVVRAFQSHFLPGRIMTKGLEFYLDENSKFELDHILNRLIGEVANRNYS